MRGKRIRGSAGFALAATLMVLLVAVILITGVLAMAISAYQLSSSRQEYSQAMYLAEAGINALISDWRASGGEPAQPYLGTLQNGSTTGSYRVTWGPPDERGVVSLTSQGTTNSDAWEGSPVRLARRVQVQLDTDGKWAWDHVYSVDSALNPDYPYATINGGGEYLPSDAEDAHAPYSQAQLPTPKWDEWRQTALAQPDATRQASTNISVDADNDQHVYWFGHGTGAPEDPAAHSVPPDENYFLTDPYFPGLSYPEAYVCKSGSKRYTVTFGKEGSGSQLTTYNGLFFVHGDVIIKGKVVVNGSIIATGDITTQAMAEVSIKPTIPPEGAPADTVYPAMVAGRDILITNRSTSSGSQVPEAVRVLGVIWAGRSFDARASLAAGCVVSPSVTLRGNFYLEYGFPIDPNDPNSPRFEPGVSTPPMFNEPDIGQIQPTPRSWREL